MAVKTKLKIICTNIIWTISRIMCIFPLEDNKIFFMSYDGKQYSDSPKYVSDYLLLNNKDIKQVWGFNKDFDYKKSKPAEGIICCKKGTLSFLYHLFTAKEIVINDFISTLFKLRKNQVLLNTWHGGGTFKTIGMSRNIISDYDEFFYKAHAKNTSAFSLSSEYFKETVVTRSFLFYGETISTGMPRNAILFQQGSHIREKVLTSFDINYKMNPLVVLYAPTYRNYTENNSLDVSFEPIDFDRCCDNFCKIYKRPVIILNRSHHIMSGSQYVGVCKDATKYLDMQELIIASDILISDYSSCMWDFAITKKPIFVYAPDLETYQNNIDFFMPVQDWAFSVALNNQELENNILSYDEEKYGADLEKYMTPLRSYESAKSVELVCFWLEKKRKK